MINTYGCERMKKNYFATEKYNPKQNRIKSWEKLSETCDVIALVIRVFINILPFIICSVIGLLHSMITTPNKQEILSVKDL